MSAIKNACICFFIILSGAFISTTVFCSIFPPAHLTNALHWQIILASLCCTASMAIFHTKKLLNKQQMKIRYVFHFLSILSVMIVFSYWGGWIDFSRIGEIAVFLSLVAGIYFVIFFMLRFIENKEADEMNLHLKTMQERDASQKK